MFAFRSLLIVLFLVVASVSGLGAEAHGEVTEGAHGAEGEVAEHHGLTPNAVPLFKLWRSIRAHAKFRARYYV